MVSHQGFLVVFFCLLIQSPNEKQLKHPRKSALSPFCNVGGPINSISILGLKTPLLKYYRNTFKEARMVQIIQLSLGLIVIGVVLTAMAMFI